MTWMASWDGDGWQIVERGDGQLVQKLVWIPARRAWHCGCGTCGCGLSRCGLEPCLQQRMLEVLEVQPPRGRPGAVAPGTTFDPFTQKGY